MPLELIAPRVLPPLDESFRPAALANRAFQREAANGERLVVSLQRSGEEFSRF